MILANSTRTLMATAVWLSLASAWMFVVAAPAEAQAPTRAQRAAMTDTTSRSDSTTLVVLGVDHSTQLLARSYHPGYLRAFFDRVQPAALCIERSPEEFARGDHYEFTYEVQHVAVPYARAHGIQLCPIDWLPSRDDERLAFGRVEVVEIPAVRVARGFQGFLTLDSAALGRTLFYGESEQSRSEVRGFYDRPRAAGWPDFPRRLGLYRTFMQAMRIRAALRVNPGRTLLVVVGTMHKDDIEGVLSGEPMLRIVQPSTFGLPTPEVAAGRLEDVDLAAILSFNLLGVQPLEGPVDWPWVGEVLERFARAHPEAPELPLLRQRHAVLTKRATPAVAAASYERIAATVDSAATFRFTGVEDTRRVDCYFDPFGNLRVRQRALVEAAREWTRAGRPENAERLRKALMRDGAWSPLRSAQLAAYWERYIAAPVAHGR